MNATLLFDFLLCGCIIADFCFSGKRGWGLNVRLSRGCCLVCGFVGGQPRISSSPAEADQAASPARAVRFKAVGLGWLGGSWMSRQRCAGRRGGKAEFLCGLMGRGWAEALRCRLGVCRIVVEFLDGFCVIFSLVHGMVGISYKIFCLYGHSWSFGF